MSKGAVLKSLCLQNQREEVVVSPSKQPFASTNSFWEELVLSLQVFDSALTDCLVSTIFIILYFVSIGMLLKGVVESSLLFKDEPLTPNIGKVTPVWFFRTRAQNAKINEHWTSWFWHLIFTWPTKEETRSICQGKVTKQFRLLTNFGCGWITSYWENTPLKLTQLIFQQTLGSCFGQKFDRDFDLGRTNAVRALSPYSFVYVYVLTRLVSAKTLRKVHDN